MILEVTQIIVLRWPKKHSIFYMTGMKCQNKILDLKEESHPSSEENLHQQLLQKTKINKLLKLCKKLWFLEEWPQFWRKRWFSY